MESVRKVIRFLPVLFLSAVLVCGCGESSTSGVKNGQKEAGGEAGARVQEPSLEVKLLRARSEVMMIRDVVSLYKTKKGQLPVSLEDAYEAYGRELPDADPWGRPYVFETDGTEYVVKCHGPSKESVLDDIEHRSAGR